MTARMDSIARRAGVSVGTLYNHFADRDALLSALFSARRKQVLARVHDVIERTASLPFRQRLHAALSAMLVVDPVAARFRRLLLEEGPAPNRVEQRKKASELLAVFAPVLAHGRREGALGDDGGDVQPVFLLALTQTALWLSATSPERLSPDDAAGVVVAQFLDGASAPRRGGRR
jgi:AcrR family transcriptional regulator